MKHLPMPELSPEALKRFFQNFPTGKSEDECWMWLGTWHYPKGRLEPIFQFKGKKYIASRISYWVHNKQDPGDLLVCHTCDDPVCVNPKHLFLGTHLVNYKDSVSKGRVLPSESLKLDLPELLQGDAATLAATLGVSERTIYRRKALKLHGS